MIEHKICRLQWVDNTSITSWILLKDLKKEDLVVHGVGYLIQETEDYIVLSPHITDFGCHAPMYIPKKAIINMESLG